MPPTGFRSINLNTMDPEESAASRPALLTGWLSILAGAFMLASSLALLLFHLVWLLVPVTGTLPVDAPVVLAITALACLLLAGGIMLLRRKPAGLWIVIGVNAIAVAASVSSMLREPLSVTELGWLVVPATIIALALTPATRSWLRHPDPTVSRGTRPGRTC